jgi:CDP-6-deoxy-D-xylo-4-hexulose-3-dehydrase
MSQFVLPLMADNINEKDVNELVSFLQQRPIPKLTNGPKVKEFEEAWSRWLGVKHSLFVNSGSSANELTMQVMRKMFGDGEIIVPPLTWVSDIAAVMHAGLKPVFCDINKWNLSFNPDRLVRLITPDTKGVFLTHVLGIDGLTDKIIDICRECNLKLIEDCCESHGVTHKGRKAGSFGYVSNFSFYYAHHMSTIEGGMVCTNDTDFYELARCYRSHGMLRESTDEAFKAKMIQKYPELNKDFIFIGAAHNFRSTELNAVIGLSQLPRLDNDNEARRSNFAYFMHHLNGNRYHKAINMDGQSNYAFIVILNDPNFEIRDMVERELTANGIEFRRGLSGGGSQLKQPYLNDFKYSHMIDERAFPNMEHIHHFSWYIGNYPSLKQEQIDKLLAVLNRI